MTATTTEIRTPPRGAWPAVAVTVAAVAWGANQFAPLLLVYRDVLGVSSTIAQATFGCYALGLVPGLLAGGPLSDRLGRKPVLVAALLASTAASLVLLAGAHGVGLLFAGRALAGLASGAAFSAGAAWIKELSGAAGARRATVAMTAGFAAGPFVAGLLAQGWPTATAVPYLPHVALTLVALGALTRVPAPPAAPSRTRGGSPWRDPRFRRIVAPLAPWVFGAAAIPLAFLPGLVSDAVGGGALVFGALVAAGTALAGIAVQPLASRLGRLPLLVAALTAVAAGMVLSALSAWATSPVLVAVAALVLGGAYGLCQVSGLGEVQRLASPERLAATTAAYQCLSYTGFALPFLLAAVASSVAPAVGLLVLAALSLVTLLVVADGVRRLA